MAGTCRLGGLDLQAKVFSDTALDGLAIWRRRSSSSRGHTTISGAVWCLELIFIGLALTRRARRRRQNA